jgi:hypothetical protein
MAGFDVIGDIHGHGDHLRRLLDLLGYREVDGVHRHPERRAVFLGDLIDRGPDQLEVLEIVRAMVEAGTAKIVMGNHEFNAIAYATPHPERGWCRRHTPKNFHQHEKFLRAVGWHFTPLHREWIDWFRTMPLWLDLDGLRIVHACWDQPSIDGLGSPYLTDELIQQSEHEPLGAAIERILKGPEIDLEGVTFADKDGHERGRARFRWWDPDATTLAEAADIPHDAKSVDGSQLPHRVIDRSKYPGPTSKTPVLFGHYWRSGEPVLDNELFACLDWSVAKGGRLVAYQWSGEPELDEDHLVSVA